MPHKSRKPKGRGRGETPPAADAHAVSPPPSPTSRRRVWLFRLAAVVIGPLLVLGLLEIGLRAIRYGYNPHMAVRYEVEGRPYLGDNVKFGWRFFSPILAREFEPFLFPAEKPAGTCRIFVLGASAAQGAPNNAFRFGRILEAMLQRRFPDTRFEVITAAMAAINSHVVVEIARDCARYDPDFFVVYLGNNEVVGPYGPGTVLTPALSNLHLIRLGIRLRVTKTGQLLAGLLGGRGLGDGGPQAWRGMAMFLGQQVRADDPRLAATYRHFRRNLQDICRVAAGAGAQTVLCTVGTNLRDCPPFASQHRPGLTPEQLRSWDAIYKEGAIAEMQGKHAEAIAGYLRAAEIDDSYAELQFRLGRCHELAGEYERARERYVKARDLDTLRFRADTQINQTIHAVAEEMKSKGVVLAEVEGRLEQDSPHCLPGEEFFHEHVHPTFSGHHTIAATVLAKVESLMKDRRADSSSDIDEKWCAERLGYNAWSRQETLNTLLHGFLEKPPFTNQFYHTEQVEKVDRQLQELRAALTPEVLQAIGAQYRATIEKAPNDWRLRWDYGQMLAEDLQQYDAAIEQYRIVQGLLPHSYMPHDSLASVMRAKGDLAGAIAEYEKLLAIKPTSGAAHYYLGWCHNRQGRADLAMELFRKAIRLEPDCVPAYLDLAEALFKRKQYQEAERVCREGLVVAPHHARLHGNLGLLLIQMGRRPEGTAEIQQALKLDPASPEIRRLAERLLGPAPAR